MNELTRVEKSFENKNITTFQWEGQSPFWIAKEIGRVLGYSDEGGLLVQLIRQEWSDEFEQGQDFDLLKGEKLTEFKASLANLPRGTLSVDPHTPALLVLYESGMDGVKLLSRKPEGKRLRRWLRDEVLPSLRRTGGYQARPPSPKEPPEPLKPASEKEVADSNKGPSAKEVYEEYKPLVLAAMAKKAAEGNLEAAHMYLSLGKPSPGATPLGGSSLYQEEQATKTSQIEALLLFGAKPAELLQKGFSKTLVYAVFARLRARLLASS